jgi:hypothetical protein
MKFRSRNLVKRKKLNIKPSEVYDHPRYLICAWFLLYNMNASQMRPEKSSLLGVNKLSNPAIRQTFSVVKSFFLQGTVRLDLNRL